MKFARLFTFLPEPRDREKLFFLAIIFFIVTGSYAILRPFKITVFLSLVGKEYQPLSKLFTMILVVPCMFLYSRLVDRFRKHEVLYVMFSLYALLGLGFAYLLTSPVFGLSNTDSSPYRILGWTFLIVMDLYPSFVIGAFWAFCNSINTPDFAKKYYGFIAAVAKIGGLVAAGVAWFALRNKSVTLTVIPKLIAIASIVLIGALFAIFRMNKRLPKEAFRGYESTIYREKGIYNEKKRRSTGVFEGLWLLLSQPYIFGIFLSYYSFEVISTILEYQMQVLMSIENNNAIVGMSSFMFLYMMLAQGVGFLFALFGAPLAMKYLKMRHCLIMTPLCVIGLVGIFLFHSTLSVMLVVMILLRAFNYGLNAPIRENLYIPTVRSVRFKSKAWIDSFGRNLSKTSGAAVTITSQMLKTWSSISFNSVISIGVAICWSVISISIGNKYSRTIKNGEIIGSKENAENS